MWMQVFIIILTQDLFIVKNACKKQGNENGVYIDKRDKASLLLLSSHSLASTTYV